MHRCKQKHTHARTHRCEGTHTCASTDTCTRSGHAQAHLEKNTHMQTHTHTVTTQNNALPNRSHTLAHWSNLALVSINRHKPLSARSNNAWHFFFKANHLFWFLFFCTREEASNNNNGKCFYKHTQPVMASRSHSAGNTSWDRVPVKKAIASSWKYQ